MGYNTALDLSEELDLEMALSIHLQSNHYPPVPLSMVEPCIEAIDAYYDESYDRLIVMPEGVLYKGLTFAPASAIVEQHHLEWFIEPVNEDLYE
jgi:hypothetical protein